MKSKNKETLKDFTKFCENNPTLRFWQALRVWSQFNFIYVTNNDLFDTFSRDKITLQDTYYFEGKNK
jgi:hypothetical protein